MNQTIEQIFDKLKEKNYTVVAPCKDGDKLFFKEVNSADEIVLDYSNTGLSVKEWFFPRTEVVMDYENKHTKDVSIKDVEISDKLTAIIGVRPCDAKSLSIMDEVFSWDYKDEFYFKRRENTLVLTIACDDVHQDCYCDKLGIAIDSIDGADILLKSSNSGFDLKVVTDKGKSVFVDAEKTDKRERSPSLNTAKIKKWLDDNFESDLWDKIAKKCLGCGVCAFVCPTCHCFDIVDEAGYSTGCRRKNWDSCGFGNFTLHTSGHNPRLVQRQRFRNRVMHKFKYYDDKFGKIACVGCGRCKRSCPVSMNLQEILEKIEKF